MRHRHVTAFKRAGPRHVRPACLKKAHTAKKAQNANFTPNRPQSAAPGRQRVGRASAWHAVRVPHGPAHVLAGLLAPRAMPGQPACSKPRPRHGPRPFTGRHGPFSGVLCRARVFWAGPRKARPVGQVWMRLSKLCVLSFRPCAVVDLSSTNQPINQSQTRKHDHTDLCLFG
jgi:hypothetical protein